MPEPEGFSWFIPGVLAAMARPRDTRGALEFMKDKGIEVIVSLTETPMNPALIAEFGFEYHHIPVEDFAAPAPHQIEEFVSIARAAQETGRSVVVHCLAGRGRTGTMLACYLVSLGHTAEDALTEVRRLRPGSVETDEQMDAVRDYDRRRQRRS